MQRPHGNGGIEHDALAGAGTARDDAGELVAEDERPVENRVADAALEEPVTIGAAETDAADAHEHLPRLRLRVRLVVQPELARRRAGEAPSRRLAVVGGSPVLAREVLLEQLRRDRLEARRPARQSGTRSPRPLRARSRSRPPPRQTAPQTNGPCEATSTAGTSSGSSSSAANVSTITSPVARSYSPSISAGVSARVTGTAPSKWSAWVVP